jgi:hypothetical protein
MQLRSLALRGFRRFADARVNLESPVTAIVGPNEAGKSTLLEALWRMNDDEPIESSALTHGTRNAGEVIRVRFRLSDTDHASMDPTPKAGQARWLIIGKAPKGDRQYYLDPPVDRPLEARRAALEAVRSVLGDKDIANIPRTLRTTLAKLQADLSSEASDLPPAGLGTLDTAIAEVRVGVRRAQRQPLPDTAPLMAALQGAWEIEQGSFSDAVAHQLAARVPRFVLFDDNSRSLGSTYDLARGPRSDALRPNQALDNLLTLAGIQRKQLLARMNQADGQAAVDSMFDSGEIALQRALEDWTQTDGAHSADTIDRTGLRIKFSRQGTVLHISVSTGGTRFDAMGIRSDGLRAFVALRAFLAGKHQVRPILLVDEAETHLHYDAQAELISVFEEQHIAACVIHTTHSIGCLPRDLGRGVRVVAKGADGHSDIVDAWAQEAAGSRPLVRAMGAATIPLAPSRAIVVAEGASEPILLPSLLREVMGSPAPFQVVNRLSAASEHELEQLKQDAPNIAFLVDGDDSGIEKVDQLRKIGFKRRSIVSHRKGHSLEDLIDPQRFVEAVESQLRMWGALPPEAGGPTVTDLATGPRARALARWCESRGIKVPSHSHVAAEVLRLWESDESPTRRLSDRKRERDIRRLHASLVSALGVGVPTGPVEGRIRA